MNLQRAREAMPGPLLINSPVHLRWLSGFTGSFGIVVVTENDAVLITDSRYTIQAKAQVQNMRVVSFSSGKKVDEVLREEFDSMKVQSVYFEPSVSYEQFDRWRTEHSDREWTSMGATLSSLRKIKSAEEVTKIRAACELADACMEHASRMIQPGIAEFDIGLDIEFFFRRHGAVVGFDPIVASGPNSAKPHARPSERKIEKGDFVTLDLGATLDGYSSDITRTFVVGQASDRHKEIYEQVLRAEMECCEMLKPGANGRDIDRHARVVLDEKDMAQYFGHSLGHGLGAQVHDPGRLHESVDEPIQPGQVWTVEPGVYIEGFGGVRVEDDVLVTETGPEILTHFPKHLTEL